MTAIFEFKVIGTDSLQPTFNKGEPVLYSTIAEVVEETQRLQTSPLGRQTDTGNELAAVSVLAATRLTNQPEKRWQKQQAAAGTL